MIKEDFIKNKQDLIENFVTLCLDLFKSNKYLQLMCFPELVADPDNDWNILDIENVIRANIQGKWVQLYDENYKGFLKKTLSSEIVYSQNQINSILQKMNCLRNEQIIEFLCTNEFLSYYSNYSNFEAIRKINNNSFRDFLYSEEFSKQNKTNFLPLNIDNWTNYYLNIIDIFFSEFKVKKNNLKVKTYEKIINEELFINISVNKDEIKSNLKTDKLIIPYLKLSLIDYNRKNEQALFFYLPIGSNSICDSNNEVDFIKKHTFFMLYNYLYFYKRIIELLISPAGVIVSK
ncbi:hypothetical protein [Flavobacterium sp.]|uniref:hypothetical protein n=1 Tax=Flavobacterium sp. TaxID=239 RepID=UPI004048207B